MNLLERISSYHHCRTIVFAVLVALLADAILVFVPAGLLFYAASIVVVPLLWSLIIYDTKVRYKLVVKLDGVNQFVLPMVLHAIALLGTVYLFTDDWGIVITSQIIAAAFVAVMNFPVKEKHLATVVATVLALVFLIPLPIYAYRLLAKVHTNMALIHVVIFWLVAISLVFLCQRIFRNWKHRSRHQPLDINDFENPTRIHQLIALNNDLVHCIQNDPMNKLAELATYAKPDYFRSKLNQARTEEECQRIADQYESKSDAIKEWLSEAKKEERKEKNIDATLAAIDSELLEVPSLQGFLKDLDEATDDHQISLSKYRTQLESIEEQIKQIHEPWSYICEEKSCEQKVPAESYCLCQLATGNDAKIPVSRLNRSGVILSDESLEDTVRNGLQNRFAHLLKFYDQGDLVALSNAIMEEAATPEPGKTHDDPIVLLAVIELLLADLYQTSLTWKVPRVYQEYCVREGLEQHWLFGIKGQLVTYAATLGHRITGKAGLIYLDTCEYFSATGAWQRSLYKQRASEFSATVNAGKSNPLKKRISQVKAELNKLKTKSNNLQSNKNLNSIEIAVELKKIDHQQEQLEQTLTTLKATLREVVHLEKSQVK